MDSRCLYTGLVLHMPYIGWIYTGPEKTSYSMLHYSQLVGWLVGWSLTSLFSTNTAISETNYSQSVHSNETWLVNSFVKNIVLGLVLVLQLELAIVLVLVLVSR